MTTFSLINIFSQRHPVYRQDKREVDEVDEVDEDDEVGRDIGSDDTIVYTPIGSDSDRGIEDEEMEEEKETEEEMRKRERRRESRLRCRRYTKEERYKYFQWTERYRLRSSGEIKPTVIQPGEYIVDQILCTGDKEDTEGLYLVGWVHPDPKKSYRPSWQLPRDVPKDELKLYKKQGVITETEYDSLLDYLEDYGIMQDYDKDADCEDSDDSVLM